jgi:hypothetical protein
MTCRSATIYVNSLSGAVVWLLDLKPSILSFSKKLDDKLEKLKI